MENQKMKIEFLKPYIKFWKNAFNFSGRTSRKDFFVPFIAHLLIFVISFFLIQAAFEIVNTDMTFPNEFLITEEDSTNSYFYIYNNNGVKYGFENIVEFSKANCEKYGFQNFLLIILSFIISPLFCLVTIVPNLSLFTRRLHDTGKPGALLLLLILFPYSFIIFILFFMQKSQVGFNKYGHNPYEFTFFQKQY